MKGVTSIYKKIRIAILGSNGQLGQEFKHIAHTYEYIQFDFFSKQLLDVSDAEQVKASLSVDLYDFVINCAAYTGVDKAESDSEKCFSINTTACQHIVDALYGTKTKLVHFSSDYVYHHFDGFPLKEDSDTHPVGIYATSKLKGENIIRSSNVSSLIIRTSWVISPYGHNFVKTMCKLGMEKDSLNVVNDQYGSLTNARDLANAVLDIITQVLHNPLLDQAFNDTYNYANEGIVTWYDIARYIMKEKNIDCNIKSIPSTSYPTPVKRPAWSVLSKQKIKETFHLEILHWYKAMQACLAEM